MANKKYPSDLLEQASSVLAACKQIDPQAKTSVLDQPALVEAIARNQALHAQLNALELQLTELRIQRDQDSLNLWNRVKRTRALVKGLYGDDSAAYELIGGTRASQRKKYTPKTEVE